MRSGHSESWLVSGTVELLFSCFHALEGAGLISTFQMGFFLIRVLLSELMQNKNCKNESSAIDCDPLCGIKAEAFA